jgi:hypothetical protein
MLDDKKVKEFTLEKFFEVAVEVKGGSDERR